MDNIIQFKTTTGNNRLFPKTVSDAVTVGNKTLSDVISELSVNGFRETSEEGLYITDSNGYVICKYTDAGVSEILSDYTKAAIQSLIDNKTTVVDETTDSKIYDFNRLTDSGYITSPVFEKNIYIKDVVAGSNDFYVYDNGNFIKDDYLRYSFNCVGISVTSIVFADHSIHITFTADAAHDSVIAIVDYTALTLNNYDAIHITVSSPSITTASTVTPSFATFKYNKDLALAITSDDQGVGELERNWAFFNGYPTSGEPIKEPMPYRGDAYLKNILDSDFTAVYASTHTPLTYTDDTGAVRRFAATSAVFGYNANTATYRQINGTDASTMRRYRWSFAHHDASVSTDAATVASEFKRNSDSWAEHTTVGMKIMVEPNGDHKYLLAVMNSPEMCMSVFQNNTAEYLNYSLNGSDWTTGKDITGFRTKPHGGFIRTFFQDSEANFFTNILSNGTGKIVMGGTHGLGTDACDYLQDIATNRDDIWVASTDEIWEYYHNYNNSRIVNLEYETGEMSFDVLVPKYAKHQFAGELTINIPLTDVTACTLSSNNSIGGYRQNQDKFTINTGIETQIYDDIAHTIQLCRESNCRTELVRDAQYMINLLAAGDMKLIYQTALDNLVNSNNQQTI